MKKHCPQCNKHKYVASFVRNGSVRRICNGCFRTYYATGSVGYRATRRGKLDSGKDLRAQLFASKKNRKLGDIPSSMTSAATCPDACAFKDSGCFAEFGFLRYFWEQVSTSGPTWAEFCDSVTELPEGQLWRHNVAGDLPGLGDHLDVDSLLLLAAANLMAGARGFTYTHKPLLDERHRFAVRRAIASGLIVNWSANSLDDADQKLMRGVAPVAVVLPSDSPTRGLRTPKGAHVVVCPAETHGITCERCQLCAVPNRKSVVGFLAHGQWKKKVNELVQLRRSA